MSRGTVKRQRPIARTRPQDGRQSAVGRVTEHLSALTMEKWPLNALRPNPRNARTHSDRQVGQIANSIATFGFLVPILIDEGGMILAGHGRAAAARSLGLREVPVSIASHLSPELKRLFAIADNRLAELAGWDDDILRVEFAELEALELEVQLDLTGFDSVDVDQLLSASPSEADPDDAVEEPSLQAAAVSQPGDLWLLGMHKVLCADARAASSWDRLMGDDKADIAFTDPPYNVKIDGHVSGLGRVKHREFAMASGEMTSSEFMRFLDAIIVEMVARSRDGAIHYICMDWRHQVELLTPALQRYGALKNLCVWNKTNAGMGSFYRNQHELVHVFKVGTAAHVNNFGLGERKRYRTNVWTYAGVNSFGRNRLEELEQHPTVKPVLLVADALRDCSHRGDTVLDPFGGSGTTLMAAERTRRRARLMEIDPHYTDVIVRRWQKCTGQLAALSSSGRSFDEISVDRGSGESLEVGESTADQVAESSGRAS